MPNTYFRFRQFTVHQDRTAMKVCTDACLFGAWVASEISDENLNSVIDIGAGTGLLSLMLAQVTDALIDAVEIDDEASRQASDNFNASMWKQRLRIYHTSIQEYNPSHTYDLLISNPPFYEKDLKSDDIKRNLALHSSELNFDDLFNSFKKLLTPGGIIAVLIPAARCALFEKKIKDSNYFVYKKVNVRQTPEHKFFRTMYLLRDVPSSSSEEELVIKNKSGLYSQEFNQLLKEYYL